MIKRLIVISIMLYAGLLTAHPHVFIEYTTEVVISNEGLEGLQMVWYFDDMFSWQIVFDYTEDQDFNISPEESGIIEKEAFSYLEESGYFADFYVDGKKVIIQNVTDFRAECIDETLIYHFFIPWKIPAGKDPVHLKICFFDKTIFCEIVPLKDSFKIKSIPGISTEYSMLDRVTYQFNFWKE